MYRVFEQLKSRCARPTGMTLLQNHLYKTEAARVCNPRRAWKNDKNSSDGAIHYLDAILCCRRYNIRLYNCEK